MSARSYDHGTSFESLMYMNTLPDPDCKAGLASFPDDGTLVFANNGIDSARTDVTLRVSRDGGHTWYEPQLLYSAGKSGYVDVDTSILDGQKYAHVVFGVNEVSTMYVRVPIDTP